MQERPRRRLAAILAADVAGYSRLMGRDEEGVIAMLRRARRDVIDPRIGEYGGRIANTAGDSLLVEFPSVVDAVRCARAIQLAMAEADTAAPDDRRLTFRMGVHIGDVVSEGTDLLGDGVNIAARIESLGAPGGIALSDDAYRQVRDRLDIAWRDFGDHALKNIARPVRVWSWSPHAAGEDETAYTPALSPRTTEADRPSIAILPFDNMSGDVEQGYFADGITEDIITEVSRLPELLVIARNSTFAYKGKATNVQDVCRELNVGYVVEGSVRKSGRRLRITAQLIDGLTGGHVWAERYDREVADVFAVQDDVTAKIVEALKLKLTAAEPARPNRNEPKTPEAYDRVLRGREQYRLFTRDSNLAARGLFQQAIDLDPDYAEPYAGLAETHVQQWLFGEEASLERAYELAEAGAARDPSLPLVQEALSTVHLFMRRHDQAIAAARRWIELEPSSADAHATLAGALHFSGRNGAIAELIEQAMRLNPMYPFFYPHYVGLANFGMGRFEAAAAAFQRAAARSPDALWPRVFLVAAHGLMHDAQNADLEKAEVLRLSPEFSATALLKLLPYKDPADIDRLMDGLRQAGLAT